MKATQIQINIIANRANTYSDGGERSAAQEVGIALFPESEEEILWAIRNHPINLRWTEYRIAKDKSEFLLPEK